MAAPEHLQDPVEPALAPAVLSDVLRQVSAELVEQALQLTLIEQAVGALSARVTGLDQQLLHELQHLDAVRQSVDALAAFAADLAGLLPADWQTDVGPAVAPVKLARMAERLRGMTELTAAFPHGDVELFD